MINLENSDLEKVLLTISTYNKDSKLVGGLLSEELTFGTKRKLQKIHKATYEKYTEFVADKEKLAKEFKDKPEELEKEFQELLKEKVKLDVEPILLSALENVSTKNMYDFEIIEKIAM